MPSKITRLSPTDVVNISALPSGKKRSYLEALETPNVFWGYKPVYDAFPKILMVNGGLFSELPKDSDEAILAEIKRACHRDEQEEANVAVAVAIMKWRDNCGARGVLVSPEPFRSTTGSIKFCSDVAVVMDSTLFVINLDVRSNMNLSLGGKELMKSLIHHTALIGDLKEAKVAILGTPKISKGVRKCGLEVLEGEPVHTIDEVENSILETYSIWELILMSRRSGTEEAAAGDSGPLFG